MAERADKAITEPPADQPGGSPARAQARIAAGLPRPRSARAGLLCGLGAYTIWGFIPVYFRAVSNVPALVVLCHRIVWSALFMTVVVSVTREWRPVLGALKHRRHVALLCLGAMLIALNWLIFIYAVASRQVLQASLGYFINPLLSIALGMIFLGEKLRQWQWAAVLVALTAVINLSVRASGVPWIAVSLAGTFGFYGLVRKKVEVNSLHGLLVESLVLCPFALAALLLLRGGQMPPSTFGLLSLSGVITAVPLLLFGSALRSLRLSTVGFLQYVGPTLQFLVATAVFQEPLDRAKLGSFALCWLAILVYVADSIVNRSPPSVADEPE